MGAVSKGMGKLKEKSQGTVFGQEFGGSGTKAKVNTDVEIGGSKPKAKVDVETGSAGTKAKDGRFQTESRYWRGTSENDHRRTAVRPGAVQDEYV